eukprot:1287882-Rhodomonas_salina.1
MMLPGSHYEVAIAPDDRACYPGALSIMLRVRYAISCTDIAYVPTPARRMWSMTQILCPTLFPTLLTVVSAMLCPALSSMVSATVSATPCPTVRHGLSSMLYPMLLSYSVSNATCVQARYNMSGTNLTYATTRSGREMGSRKARAGTNCRLRNQRRLTACPVQSVRGWRLGGWKARAGLTSGHVGSGF